MIPNEVNPFRQLGPYKHGQVAWALWRTFTGPGVPRSPSVVPKWFARRVAKFIELGVPLASPFRPGRPGTDLEFRLGDAAEIAIALDLQDIGLNQLEISRWLIRHRATIRALIERATPGTYLAVRSRMIALPAQHRGDPFGPEGDKIGEPVVMRAPELAAELGKLAGLDRKRIIIEIGDLIEFLEQSLALALVVKRGRQS